MTLAAIARNICMLTAQQDLEIKTLHIPGKENILADTLSRLYQGPHQLNKLTEIMPAHVWVQPPDITAGGPSKFLHLTKKAASTLPLALAESTRRSYKAMFRVFLAFCVYYHIPTDQVTAHS